MSAIRALVLPEDLRAQIEREARGAYPRECCGLLEGTVEHETVHVLWVHPARNQAVADDRFEIDPADHFRALRTARANGREIVGCYHSHPNGVSEPSPRDLESASEEGFIWLIAAGTDRKCALQAFVFEGARFALVFLDPTSGPAGVRAV